jgi:signal transduction histidine kinase/DNA-binding response OmpR family regulator/streptogramin lyase
MRSFFLSFLLLIVIHSYPQKARIIVPLPVEESQIKEFKSFFHDSRGFMWMANRQGLYRFDGYHFKVYKQCIINSDTIDFNSVSGIVEDNNKDLWIVQLKGVFKYLVQKDLFLFFPFPDSLEIPSNFSILNDSKNILWVGTTKGLLRFDKKKNQFYHFSAQTGIGPGGVMSIFETRNHKMYIATWEGGISEYQPSTDRFRNIPFKNVPWFAISCINEDSYGTIWVSGYLGKFYKFRNDSLIPVSNPVLNQDFMIWNFFIDKKNTIWFTCLNNIIEYIPETNKVFEYYLTYTNSPLNAPVFAGYYDKSDEILWVGTEDGPRKVFLKNWAEQYYVYPKLRDYLIKSVSFYNHDEFLLQSNKKFLRMKPDGKIIKEIPSFETNYNDWAIVNKKTAKLDIMTGKYSEKEFIPDSILSRQTKISSLKEISATERLLWGSEGFVYYDMVKKAVNVIPSKQLPPAGFNLNNPLKLNADSIMFFGPDKVFIYSINKNKIYTHKHFPFFINTFAYINDTVWIISDNDLVRYTPKNNQIKNYPVSNLTFNISHINVDKHHNLWILDYQNISYFDVKKEVFQLFKIGNIINFHSLSFDFENNRLLLGGYDNILICNPDSFIHSIKASSLHFTRFFVNNTEYCPANYKKLHTDIFYLNKINLKPYQSSFSIEFSALEYIFPESIIYEYMLEGIDAAWYKVKDGSNLATYKKIPNGSYVFRLRKESDPGSEIQLQITVLPYWWQTWWFKIILALFVAFAIFGFYLIRTRQIRIKNIQLEKLVKERTKTIEEQKEEIKGQADILLQVNQELNEQKDEVQSINEELRSQSEELYITNEELQKLNATKDKFFSIIAHDLKNPFHAISGSAEYMETQSLSMDDATRNEFIKVIKNSSKNASNLLENLLQWARSQTNSISYNPENFDLFYIADENIQLLKTNADNKRIRLINDVGINSFAFADRNMISTVLRNLINNAIKFTPAEGTITVSTQNNSDLLELIVSDTGVGMDEITRNKLFRIDQHVTSQGTSGEAGTGLGLIICKEFIDKNNGVIRVESEIGKGSRFIISLPASDYAEIKKDKFSETVVIKEQKISVPVKEINLSPKDKYSPWVLIVEDNDDIRKNLKNSIDKYYNIAEAVNGREGLNKAFADMPELIISDWMMPEMEGIELCAMLKKDERTSHIPIILLTAKSDVQDKIEGLETGADDYLTKPFNTQELLLRIHNLFESRKKIREKVIKELLIDSKDFGLNPTDDVFLKKAIALVEKHMEDVDFDVTKFTKEIGLSRTQLYNKLTALTNQSSTEFIRTIRLKKAAQLISEQGLNINEVYWKVGFNNRGYFTRSFTDIFGVSPSEYKRKK